MSQRILVVDDAPASAKLLRDLLSASGYTVFTAYNGAEALARLALDRPEARPDLVLLDVRMPGLDGYEVCRAIRADPANAMLPVVMVTALDAKEERVRGLEAGADDFLPKPVHHAELIARVRSLLRIKTLYDQVERQARELEGFNRTLEQRVAEGIAQVERLTRLKRFFSPQVADLIVAGGTDDPLRSHRREIVVVFVDLRGFTAFSETADPEEVMELLRDYHRRLGRLVHAHEGTLERFSGDGIMIFFNDPVEVPDPAVRAVAMALGMRAEYAALQEHWQRRGYDVTLGIGIAQGFATLGAIGFEGRLDYGAVGPVCNLAWRLCAAATAGQILVPQRVLGQIEHAFDFAPMGERHPDGFRDPIRVFNVTGARRPPG